MTDWLQESDCIALCQPSLSARLKKHYVHLSACAAVLPRPSSKPPAWHQAEGTHNMRKRHLNVRHALQVVIVTFCCITQIRLRAPVHHPQAPWHLALPTGTSCPPLGTEANWALSLCQAG
mmetsp:Transcript_109018/g.189230  ORF Transcript_109018/g.189230 Transcript_109018/m.189230 type:complete len:120 (-) Transcript_109018:573-932(-)